MAKQTFTTGQVLTAAQMTSLQQTAMGGGAASAKTASYTLVAADAGTAISMSSASATTITVNTNLFADGDTVQITNIGAGVCTITAGTATVNTASSLALAQWESGTLYFRSSSAAVFIKGAGAAASTGLTFQNVYDSSERTTTSTSYTSLGSSSAVTLTTGTKALVLMGGQIRYYGGAITFNVSGSTSSTGDDSRALIQETTGIEQVTRHFVITGLTAGSNTFTLQYRSTSGNNVQFARTNITVIDLGS